MKQKKPNDVEEEEVILVRLSFYLIRLAGVLVKMNKFDIEKKNERHMSISSSSNRV